MTPKAIVISVLVFFGIVVGLAYVISAGQKLTPAPVTFASQDSDRPRAETAQTMFNLGEIKVSDVKQQDFMLKNSGTKPLQILGVSSSCGCTAGQIIYQGTTSREYSMHSQKGGLVAEIAPGDTAVVRLTYRPATMPVFGAVGRDVYVTTNDPDKQKLTFSIRAIVK